MSILENCLENADKIQVLHFDKEMQCFERFEALRVRHTTRDLVGSA